MDAYNFTKGMTVNYGWVTSWWRRLWWKITPWWERPPLIVEDIDIGAGTIEVRLGRWSWWKWRWV